MSMCHPWQPGLEASWHINVAGVGKFETLLNSKTYQISDRSGRGRGEPGESTCWCCVLMLSLVCGVMLISGRCRQPCNEMLMWRHGILSVLHWLLACSVGKWNYLNVCRCSWSRSERCYYCLAGDDTVTMLGPCMPSLLPSEVCCHQPMWSLWWLHLTNERPGVTQEVLCAESILSSHLTHPYPPSVNIHTWDQVNHDNLASHWFMTFIYELWLVDG